MLFVSLPLLLTKFFPVAIIKLSSTLSAAVAVWARRRIGNPVQIRNGTATVCVQAPHAAKASHWELPEKAVCRLSKHKSGDLLKAFSAAFGVYRAGGLFCARKTAAAVLLLSQLFA